MLLSMRLAYLKFWNIKEFLNLTMKRFRPFHPNSGDVYQKQLKIQTKSVSLRVDLGQKCYRVIVVIYFYLNPGCLLFAVFSTHSGTRFCFLIQHFTTSLWLYVLQAVTMVLKTYGCLLWDFSWMAQGLENSRYPINS